MTPGRLRAAIGGGVLVVLLIIGMVIWSSRKPASSLTPPQASAPAVVSADGGAGKASPAPAAASAQPAPPITADQAGEISHHLARRWAIMINDERGRAEYLKAVHDGEVQQKKIANLYNCCSGEESSGDPGKDLLDRIRRLEYRAERDHRRVINVPADHCSSMPPGVRDICNSRRH